MIDEPDDERAAADYLRDILHENEARPGSTTTDFERWFDDHPPIGHDEFYDLWRAALTPLPQDESTGGEFWSEYDPGTGLLIHCAGDPQTLLVLPDVEVAQEFRTLIAEVAGCPEDWRREDGEADMARWHRHMEEPRDD